jgi:hypothetical protein
LAQAYKRLAKTDAFAVASATKSMTGKIAQNDGTGMPEQHRAFFEKEEGSCCVLREINFAL